MPTIFSHAVFAAVAGRTFFAKPLSKWFWFLTAVCAIIPDADVIGYSLGVERGLSVIFSEIIWIWLPVLALLIITTIARKAGKRK